MVEVKDLTKVTLQDLWKEVKDEEGRWGNFKENSLGIVGRLLGVCPRIRSWRRKPPRNNLLTVIWTLSWSN